MLRLLSKFGSLGNSPYICHIEIRNKLNKKNMITKDEIKNFGEANNWRGCIGLYFTKKKVSSLKKLGISEGTPIKEAYKLIK